MKNYNKKEIDKYGDIRYYLNKKLHRIDGPAIEYPNGTRVWCINGILHRDNGPAIEYSNGYKSWYINGIYYTKQEFHQYIESKKSKCPQYIKNIK